jgi:site-specific DNA recombinase
MSAAKRKNSAPQRRAALYVRISDDPEGLEKGVDRQEQDCRAFAEAHSMAVVEVFRENDTSAFKQRTIVLPSGEKVRRVVRPRFRAMLQMLSKGGGDAMVAYDLDRAVRDPRDLEDLIDAKVLYGFDVHSTTGNLRLDSDSDVAMARVLVAMANKSSADTARRVARAARQGAVEGRWYGGSPPYGYRGEGATLVVVPEQARLVREGARRILAGESLYMICCIWNERGERTGNGKLWRERSLKLALRNPATKGIRAYRPLMPDGRRSRTPEIVTKGNWKAILSKKQWAQVNEVLDAREATMTTNPEGGSAKRVWPFTGLIRCARCGNAMRKMGVNYICIGHVRGVCARSINAAEINDVIEQAVLAVFATITTTGHPTRRDDQSPGKTAQLQEQLSADRIALERLDDDHYDGTIDRATWLRQRSRLVDRITARQHDYQKALPARPLAVIDAATVADEWPGRTPAWRHEATRLVLDAALIHAQPAGMASVVRPLRDDTEETYRARLRDYRQKLLARRVELVWHA